MTRAALALLLLTGCRCVQGDVVAKDFHPAEDYDCSYNQCVLRVDPDGDGFSICQTWIRVHRTCTRPEFWSLSILTERGERKVEVPRSEFDRTEPGDWWASKRCPQ